MTPTDQARKLLAETSREPIWIDGPRGAAIAVYRADVPALLDALAEAVRRADAAENIATKVKGRLIDLHREATEIREAHIAAHPADQHGRSALGARLGGIQDSISALLAALRAEQRQEGKDE